MEIGLRTIDVATIRGTAVGGGDQRGADFLPLRGFRGKNWQARWQRLRRAHDAMVDLPPIDVVKYDGAYWLIDGHNRVGLALYVEQVDIDASVVELVPSGLAPLSIGLGEMDEAGVTGPTSVVGQEVRFCAVNDVKTGHSARLQYRARVVNEGTFGWEPAVMQLPGAPELLAMTPTRTLVIQAP